MTTGEPGTPAQVTNSGSEQDAVFDFVIPKGDPGENCCDQELLSAYSTPSKPGSDGMALVFDKNGAVTGTAITHTEGTGEFVIHETGYYFVTFHGTLSPGPCTQFPLTISIYLQQQGDAVPGAGVSHTFQTSSDNSSVAFSQIIQVSDPAETLRIIAQGENFIYTEVAVTIHRIGQIS